MNAHNALLVAGIVFTIVALINLTRIILKFEVVIAGKLIPIWANMIGCIVAACLAIWMFGSLS